MKWILLQDKNNSLLTQMKSGQSYGLIKALLEVLLGVIKLIDAIRK